MSRQGGRAPAAVWSGRHGGVDRLTPMEAVFIALMVLVVLLGGFVGAVVLLRLMKVQNR